MTTAAMSICRHLLLVICLLVACKASALSRNEKATEAASDSNELPNTTSVSMESTDFTQRESTDSGETLFGDNNIQTTEDRSTSVHSHIETRTSSNDELEITSTATQNPTKFTAMKLENNENDELDLHNNDVSNESSEEMQLTDEESKHRLDENEVGERLDDSEVDGDEIAVKYNQMNGNQVYWNRTMILSALVIGFASLLFSGGLIACVWRFCCYSNLAKHLVLDDAEENEDEVEDINLVASAHLNIKDSTHAVFEEDNIIII